MFYILYISQNGISSIIWIPDEIQHIDEYILAKNRLVTERFKIDDANYTNVIIRLLSSDGASIINRDGEYLFYGCIVNLNSIHTKEAAGTGESAAKLLSQNGIGIKISQDGLIKIFYRSGERELKI